MSYLWPLASLWALQLLAVISPGQSFVIASKVALSSGRAAGVAAAFGMGLGTLVWSVSAIVGLALLLERLGWLYTALKLAGGLYLVFLAWQIWRNSGEPPQLAVATGRGISNARAFALGFTTQIANPKVAIFFGSIFVALLPAQAPLWVYAAAVAIVSFNEVLWYSIVAIACSVERSRQAYAGGKRWIDKLMAVALGGLGLKLIIDP